MFSQLRNTNLNHSEIHHPKWWKVKEITPVMWNVSGNVELSYVANGSVTWSSPFGKLLAHLLNWREFILWPSNPTPAPIYNITSHPQHLLNLRCCDIKLVTRNSLFRDKESKLLLKKVEYIEVLQFPF